MKYMERQLYASLVEWKDSRNRKPLMLKGARQVGKTRLLEEFGRREFETVAVLNCDKTAAASALFQQDFDVKRIIRGISALTGVHIEPEKTLIILDEIQEVPRAIQSLKYFNEDAKEYPVCAAGSLLGIRLRGEYSYPVGKVKAEENLKAKSLKLFSEEYPEAKAIRISMAAYRQQDWLTNIPLYLALRAFEEPGR